MKVHHLNCGTMHPPATPGGLVCHVLLVETDHGLALIDSGLGLRDAEQPIRRFGLARCYVRPVFDPAEAAINQIRQLGFDPCDVRHIVLTHFDADHTGGLADFPWARVHLTDAEALAAQHPGNLVEWQRYPRAHREHGPDLVEYAPTGESWRGFPSARELTEIAPGIVLINLPGHSRGHAAIAVDAGSRWILHAGDSFYHHGQLDGSRTAPLALTAMERLVAADRSRVRANHERLTRLWSAAEPDLLLVNSHDPHLFERANQPV
ncbi:MBL fold metallo-hydrolase [Nocardia sp. NBC_01503]|uniref:MBL fold metallo-hydrolase n=1 Tax=Nocardia sp. NBC_01503 TaxID=2975997 RepID=UPI002E7BDC1E|nr:MBL fold metallo-hydrolase [Nocardia sp. NBC_01503]WTL30802.1 MBL fold metallo-hydrolase [Nocardia sp. NBC_01503]